MTKKELEQKVAELELRIAILERGQVVWPQFPNPVYPVPPYIVTCSG